MNKWGAPIGWYGGPDAPRAVRLVQWTATNENLLMPL